MTMVADNVEAAADDIAPEVEVEAPIEEVVEAEPEQTAEAVVPDIKALIKGLSADEIAALPEVNDILQRRTQSARDKATAEATTKLFAQQQDFVVSGQAERAILALADAAAENPDERGRPQTNPQEVKKLTTALLSHGASIAVSQLSNVLAAEVKDGFKLSQAEQDSIELAMTKYQQNPTNPDRLYAAWLAPLKRAWVEDGREDIKAEVRAEMKREQEAAAKTARAAQAAKNRQDSPTATSVNGTAPTGPITWETINKMYTDNEWASLPSATRDPLAAQANAARSNAGRR